MEIDSRVRQFRWAVVLSWATWIPMFIGLWPMLISINNSKATGLAALEGSMIEMLVTWGLGTLIIAQVVAIVWLDRFQRVMYFAI